MKNGGYGGLIVGKHYQIKQLEADEDLQRRRYAKWLESYNKRMEDERLERQHREFVAQLRREQQAEARAKAEKEARRLKRIQRRSMDALDSGDGFYTDEGSFISDDGSLEKRNMTRTMTS